VRATLNQLAGDRPVLLQRTGANRGSAWNRTEFKWSLAGTPRGVAAFWAGIVLLVVVLGTPHCKMRDTSGYCQLPCEKTCPLLGGGEGCVATNDPRYGCASSTTCAKCEFPNATAACDQDGACSIGGCVTGYVDCDGNTGNGCETHYVDDTKNCGACSRSCPGAETHAEFKCKNGLCDTTCLGGFKDCNTWYVDGCETEPTVECDAGTASSGQGN
jgi:hypothetical protein